MSAAPNPKGTGWDVVIRIDGTYFTDPGSDDEWGLGMTPTEMVAYWREMVGQALINSGVDMARRHNWDREEAWMGGLHQEDIAEVIDAERRYRAEPDERS